MTVLNTDAVTEVLTRLVAEKGEDYVYPPAVQSIYPTCTYTTAMEDGEYAPSCIVGHVIAELDPELFQELAKYELEEGSSLGVQELVHEGSPGYDFQEDNPQLIVDDSTLAVALAMAQEIQDRGGTWANAVAAYQEVLDAGVIRAYDNRFVEIRDKYRLD